MPSQSVTYTWQRNTNQSAIVAVVTDTQVNDVEIDVTIPASSTNYLVTVPTLTIASIKSIFIWCAAACTLKTNSSGSPTNTISLLAATPYVWQNACGYFAQPLAGTTVTAFYLTIAATSDTALYARFLSA